MYPLISIIVPVYNTEKYLKKCVDSLVSQTYHQLEIILVDDGSTDKSGSICDDYARQDGRIRVIHQENSGSAAARNAGMDCISGDYVGFVDTDDWVLPQMYEKMLCAAQEQNADIVISGIIFDNLLWQRRLCDDDRRNFDNKNLVQAYLTEPYVNNVVWNKLYRRDVLGDIRFPVVRRSEDVAFTIQVLLRSQKSVCLNECYYVQYLREGSLERSRIGKIDLLAFDAIRLKQDLVRQHYPDLYGLVEAEHIHTYTLIMKRILKQHSYKKNKAMYHELLSSLKEALETFDGNLDAVVEERYWVEKQVRVRFAYWWKGTFEFTKKLTKKTLLRLKKVF